MQAISKAELFNALEQEKGHLEHTVDKRTAELTELNQELMRENAERRLAEEIASKNESRYRSLFESTNDAVFFIGLDEMHLAANQQAADMLGYELNELIGMPAQEIILPEEHSNADQVKELLLKGETVPVYQRTFRMKNGAEIPVEINAALIKDIDGKPLHFQSVVRDITKRKNAEKEIENLAKFPAENPDPVLRATKNGQLLYANPGSVPILQKWQVSPGDNLPADIFDAYQNDPTHKDSKVQVEYPLDDQVFQFAFVPIEGTNYINIYGQNITEAKLADQMKTEFIASVSHELRTPLAAILGYAEILLDEEPGKLNEIQAEFMQIINDSSNHLHILVNDLLDVTNMETGRFQLIFSETNIEQVLQKALSYINPIADAKEILLTVEIPTSLPVLNVDSARLEQVFINLLSNSIKFTPRRGKVTLKTIQDNDLISFQVFDSGIGIPQDDLPKLFDRFYRAANVKGSNIEGTGLGLYISKAIVEGHQGKIKVSSEFGKGSCFDVSIPII